jgi:hypothetical protein
MYLLLIYISGKTILITMLVLSVLITLLGCLPLTKDDTIEEKSYSTDEEINTDISEEGIANFKEKYNLQDDNEIILEASKN